MVNRIDAAFQARDVTIVRDKRDLGYKGLIQGVHAGDWARPVHHHGDQR